MEFIRTNTSNNSSNWTWKAYSILKEAEELTEENAKVTKQLVKCTVENQKIAAQQFNASNSQSLVAIKSREF